MNRPVKLKTRPQLALESYLDALLQDATEEELPEPILVLEPLVVEPESTLDEFQQAVLEEQARDAHVVPVAVPVAPVVEAPVVVEPVVQVHRPPSITPPPVTGDGRPSWAAEPFECLLFDVAGLTLAVPLVCLGSIYSLQGQELTPLFGQPEWFLGILPSQAGNLKVLDTARWVMPDRYRDDFRQGLQYVISVQGYEWGLAVHQVSRSLRLDPNEIKWRSHRGQRPWLAGTVIEHMCALLDVAELAELIASGAVKTMAPNKHS
ncbi:CheW domain-containing protein [Pseudomonas antarctica]|uniref:CheW domain-containing protein n=1 Tax=Pseudomonas antarctica TaxID=219572 RepID=UPI0039C2ABA7